MSDHLVFRVDLRSLLLNLAFELLGSFFQSFDFNFQIFHFNRKLSAGIADLIESGIDDL